MLALVKLSRATAMCAWLAALPVRASAQEPTGPFAVGPQYDSTIVDVSADDFDRFVVSLRAVFGGTVSNPDISTVTPTPSRAKSQLVRTPTGIISVFGYLTPIPYPFGTERICYLVTDLDAALQAARESGAAILVAKFAGPAGRDAIVQWPGGVRMQLYWQTAAPHFAVLESVPETRIYLPAEKADDFVRAFISFSAGRKVGDDRAAAGVEIGQPGSVYRRISIDSGFGRIAVLVTDGHLPYPYGYEVTGYAVADLGKTLGLAKTAGVTILTPPVAAGDRRSSMLMFPGGYIAEVHSASVR
jgi:predicted enzyme related to lactoylglutathione lyase